MKKIATIIAAVVVGIAAFADTPQQKYVEKWLATAQAEMARSGVPASITLAQGILESDSGQSDLAASSNNHFGIKCHSDWTGRTVLHQAETGMECFRAYNNAEESFRDHSDFLRFQDRYKPLFDLDPTDYKAWAKGLKKAGYATDSKYPDKLIKVIEDNRLYIYDSGATLAAAPEPPASLEAPKPVDQKYKEEMTFSLARPVYEVNGVPFVYATEGETLESIALSNGLFRKEVLAYNDLSTDAVLKTGDMVFLSFKKSQAARGVEKYVVGPEEDVTLRDISQRFGVRLKSLRSMNRNLSGTTLGEGDTVILRKQR